MFGSSSRSWQCAAALGIVAVVACAGAQGDDFRVFSARQKQGYLRAAFSPDGRFVAATGTLHRTKRGHTTIWDFATGDVLAWFNDFPAGCVALDFSPDGTMLAVGCADQSVHLFQRGVNERRVLWTRIGRWTAMTAVGSDHVGFMSLQVTRDGNRLVHSVSATGWSSGGDRRNATRIVQSPQIVVWDLANLGSTDSIMNVDLGLIQGIRALDDSGGRVLVLSSRFESSSVLSTVDLNQQTIIDSFSTKLIDERYGEQSVCMDLTGDSTCAALGGVGYLWLLEPETLSVTLKLGGHGDKTGCTGVSFSPEGTTLATCGHDHTVRLWDVETGQLLCLREQLLPCCVEFSPGGEHLVTCASGENGVRVWDVQKLLAAPGIRLETPAEGPE